MSIKNKGFLIGFCILISCFFSFQNPTQITSEKDFEEFVSYFKTIDIKDNSKKITSLNTVNSLYQAIEWAKQYGTEKQNIIIKILEISYLNKIDNDREVIRKAELLLENTNVRQFKNVVYMLQDLNKAYNRTEQYNNLLNSYTLYHNLLDYHGIKSRESSKNNRIALTYYRLKNYKKAKKYFILRGIAALKEKSFLTFSSANNDIGLCFYNMNQLDSAKFYYDKAINILETKVGKNAHISFKKVIQDNIAGVWVKKENYNKALPILLDELRFSKQQNKDANRILKAYYKLANVYYLKDNSKSSLKYIDSVFCNLKTKNNLIVKEKALFLKGKNLLKNNQFNEANKVFFSAENLKDSLEQVKLEKQYVLAAVKFETEKKDLQLKQSLQQNKVNSITNNYQKIALFLLIMLLILTCFFLYKTINNKKIISKQKVEADKNVLEKDLLLKELHHRVKNNLQVISSILELQSIESKNPELTTVLRVCQDRILAMSLIHQQLYQNKTISAVNFKKYISTLISQIKKTNQKETTPVKFIKDLQNFSFPIDISVPLGLIVNELITNAYKHAFTNSINNTISIKLSKNLDTYLLNVRDNGVGIKNSIDFTNVTTLGLRLVKLLVKQMEANIQYEIDKGSSFTIVFKKNIS